MASEDNSQTTERHDPAIDPDTPDNGMGHDKPSAQRQGGAQSQGNNGAQSQENNGNQSGNSYTPDFEPQEQKSPDTTSEQKDTGAKDADIDTQGG